MRLPRGSWSCSARRCVRLVVAIAAIGCALSGDAATAANFFKASKAPPKNLDPNGIYPLGKKFALGLYTVVGNSKIDPTLSNMRRVAQAGFNLAGPYYETNWRDFSHIYKAADEGLGFTYQIRNPAALIGVPVDQRAAGFAAMTDAQISAHVREQVTAILNDPVANKTVARWSLGAEEVRYWVPAEMRYLKVASETIRTVEAERKIAHRPFWMYEPNHRDVPSLKKTGIYQDIVSKGAYFSSAPRGMDRLGNAIWSITQIVEAAKSLKTVPQAVHQLYEDFKTPGTGTNPAEIRRVIRHDVYLGLTMGIKSINVYSMYENRPNLTTHNDQFLAYSSVAMDLTGPLNLQNVFLFGEQRNDLKIGIAQGVKTVSFTDLLGQRSTFDTLHYFNAAWGSDRYLFLVNSTEQPMDVSISKLPSKFLLDDLFAGTTADVRKSSFIQRLDPLGVMAFRIRKWTAAGAAGLTVGTFSVPEPSAAAFSILAMAGFCGVRRRTHSK